MFEDSALPRYFIFRRLHSLTLFIPLGVFLVSHITLYSKLLGPEGERSFNNIGNLYRGIPFLNVFEIVFLLLPLLFHFLFGFSLLYFSKENVLRYPHQANIRYFLQNVSLVVTFLFLGYHVFLNRIQPALTGYSFNSSLFGQQFANPIHIWVSLVGGIAACYYVANGFWVFLITWGITVGPQARKISLFFCMAFFVLFSSVHSLMIAHYATTMNKGPNGLGAILNFVKNNLFWQ